ncbi:hypothetical protein FSP39_006335 [Pinctada imbricata]|uniref:B box-type domain-containing protein n=1 Tax=Pinctada imbricata TaxID=66713 RepID=A0AA88Y6V0_PINIB|nr:hypothetical protein FSP39_006335 [Pinctada imbricata]
MASRTEEFQFAVHTCREHSHEDVFSYCNTCHERICELCVKGKHKEHDWNSISKHVRKIRREAVSIAKKIREVLIPYLRTGSAKARKESNRREIIQTQQALKETIDAYTKLLLAIVDEDSSNDQELEKKIEQLIKIAEFFEDHIHSAHDHVVLDMDEEYKGKEKEIRQSTNQLSKVRSFKKGHLAEDTLKYMFGHMVFGSRDIVKPHAALVRTFNLDKISVIGVATISKTRAWIHAFESTKNVLIDDTGKTLEETDYGREFNSFNVVGKGHTFSSTEDEAILEITDGYVKTFYETKPYYASGLCKSLDGGIIVCLIEGDRSEITPTTKGEVHHVDMSGRLVKKYVRQKETNSALFTWPNKVAQNVNLDLCVLDFVDGKENDRLVAVSVDSRVRFTYCGQQFLKERFTGGDVMCDFRGQIYLIDLLNNSIHILSADGTFLQFLLTKEDNLSGPCSLSLCENTLWIGCTKGVVKIYEIET